MSNDSTSSKPVGSPDWLVGGGEMGKFIRSMDWSKTPLGPMESWPPSLRTTVGLVLNSNFPISLAWGPEHTQIYNDGYWPICGPKHPHAMGQDFSECWATAFPVIGDAFRSALAGKTAFLEDQRMFLDRLGYLEETFFTFSFSPIRDETGQVAGLFHPATETTSKMIGQRRTRTLRDVAQRAAKATSMDEGLALAADTLAESDLDVPFVLFYRLDAAGRQAALVAQTGLKAGGPASPTLVDMTEDFTPWPLAQVASTGKAVELDDVRERFPELVCGPYPEPIKAAFVLPICPPGHERPACIIVAGASVRLPMNEAYRAFYDLLAAAVTTVVANAIAYEAERKRAEALAEIDRAKTAFFSNVSHEFRTPLTLILGPLADELAERAEVLPPVRRERLEAAHRNSLRLLKLVNTLLDFARIEAGRVQAIYEPTDLAAFTAELASNFRSACERAGLRLNVDCPPLGEPVFVDREMWEKIVLNLLSNAFKFTLQGEMTVRLKPSEAAVEMSVQDTGTGIPAEELARVFERFHRVQAAEGRTHEGTGIGLALVKELTALHGGSVRVESARGQGSTFTVSIPLGNAHLPADRISASRTLASTALGAGPYVEEALRWLPDAAISSRAEQEGQLLPQHVPAATAEPVASRSSGESRAMRPRVVWADDNADMRQYVHRLLDDSYDVESVCNGEEALAAARRRPPDLVLSDVMMPRLDGFGLLRRLRADERTRTVPVVLLSARAGEESRVEGLAAGADDYLIKPFSARELLAVVNAHVQMAQVRREVESLRLAAEKAEADRESEARFRQLANSIPQLAWIARPDGWIFWYNDRWYEYTGTTPAQMEGWGWQSVHDAQELPQVLQGWQQSIATGEPFDMIFPLRGADGSFRPFLTRVMPLKDAQGRVQQWFGTNTDVSQQKRAEQELRTSEENLKASLHEKEVLLKEIHHRVKNNMQVISSLVDLQADRTQDEAIREVLRDVIHRVRSMALVHEKLYQSTDMARVEFAEYAQSLLGYLWRAHGTAASGIRLVLDLEPVPLSVNAAVPCGLILNELATNALKYAFRGRSNGEVAMSLRDDKAGQVCLRVRDNGVGLPSELDWRKAGSLGLRLVQILASQLHATVEVRGGAGTEFIITFQEPQPREQRQP